MIIDGKGLSDRTNGLKWMDGWMDGWLWQAMRLFMIYVFGIHKYRGLSVMIMRMNEKRAVDFWHKFMPPFHNSDMTMFQTRTNINENTNVSQVEKFNHEETILFTETDYKVVLA